ncbi:MAG: glycosyltransferase family 39 protein [Chloroflexota bacterium]
MEKHTVQNQLITLALLLALFGLFVFGLNWLHLRPDEELVYVHTSGSLPHTIWYQARQDVQAPLWHSFFWGWRRLAGDSELAGRYQGVLWSMLTLALLYRVMRRWFGAARYGWFAMVSVSISAYFFTYAFEVRPYPVLLLASTLCMWTFSRWQCNPTWRRTLYYGASLALLAYIHYFLVYLVLVQVIYWLANRPPRAHYWRFAAATGIALVLWSPWIHTFFYQVNFLRQIDGGSLGIASTTTDTSWPVIRRLLERATNGNILMFAGVLAVGAWRVRRREYALLLLWALAVPVIALTLNTLANVYDERYIVYLSVGLSSAVGVAVASLPGRMVRWPAIAVLAGMILWNLPGHLPNRIQYRTVMERVSTNALPGDAILFDNAEEGSGLVQWNMGMYLPEELLANRVPDVEAARGYRRVWYVSGNLVQNGVQERFWELERTHPLVMVTGRCVADGCYIAQLVETSPNPEPLAVFAAPPERTSDNLPFYGVDVESVTDHMVDMRLWWMLEQPAILDYSVSVRLTDEAGAVVAQSDGPPVSRDGNLLNTSQLEAERMTVDYRTLDTSALEPGEYDLQIVVYQPVDGYNLLVGDSEQLFLRTIIIP